MIALDTNIVLRLLVRDELTQAETAERLISSLTPENRGLICREAMMELIWVLERVYEYSKIDIGEAVLDLIASSDLEIENHEDVTRCLYRYMQGGVDFADLMILASADHQRATPLYTFDRKLARMDGAILLEPA